MSDNIIIKNQTPRVQYQADGRPSYEYPFEIFHTKNLVVYVDSVIQEPENYTVTPSENTIGGSITFYTPPTSGQTVTLMRRLELERTTDFQEGGALRAVALNHELDYQMACMQQIAEQASRTILYPPTGPAVANELFLPLPSAGKSLVWTTDGKRLENSDIEVNTLVRTMDEKVATVIEQSTLAQNAAETATNEISNAANQISFLAEQLELLSEQADETAIQITQATEQSSIAITAATTATQKADLAATKAQDATISASQAGDSALAAETSKNAAETASNTATAKALEASVSAVAAESAAATANTKAGESAASAIMAKNEADRATSIADSFGNPINPDLSNVSAIGAAKLIPAQSEQTIGHFLRSTETGAQWDDISELDDKVNTNLDNIPCVSLTPTTGTVQLISGKVYTHIPTGNIVYTLPSPTVSMLNEIEILLSLTSVYTIDWGTSVFVNGSAPDVSKIGKYTIIYEYDWNQNSWVCGGFKNGA